MFGIGIAMRVCGSSCGIEVLKGKLLSLIGGGCGKMKCTQFIALKFTINA